LQIASKIREATYEANRIAFNRSLLRFFTWKFVELDSKQRPVQYELVSYCLLYINHID